MAIVAPGGESKGIFTPERYKYLPLIIALPGLILGLVLFRDRLHEALTPTDISSPLLRSGTVTKVQNYEADKSEDGILDLEGADAISNSEDAVPQVQKGNVIIASSKSAISQGSIHKGNVKTATSNKDGEVVRLSQTSQTSVSVSKEGSSQGQILIGDNGQKYDVDPPNAIRSRCQIVYVLGVEGSGHHGISDISIQTLAKEQDGLTLKFRDHDFRRIMTAKDSSEVQPKMQEICDPNEKTVIVEDTSFPTGLEYRKIFAGRPAMDVAALLDFKPHPLDLAAFAKTFSSHADIKFVILHRPFFSVAASHSEYRVDGGIAQHGEVMSGHLRYLGKLFQHDKLGGKADWMLL